MRHLLQLSVVVLLSVIGRVANAQNVPLPAGMSSTESGERIIGIRQAVGTGRTDAESRLVTMCRADPAVQVRKVACWALGKLNLQGAIPALEQARSSDASPEVRAEAEKALAELKQKSAPPAAAPTPVPPPAAQPPAPQPQPQPLPTPPARLPDGLFSKVPAERVAGIQQVVQWRQVSAEAKLLSLASYDPDPEVRRVAVWAIGELDLKGAATKLRSLAVDLPDGQLRAQIEATVAKLTGELLPEGVSVDDGQLKYDSVVDCAPDSTDERCQEETHASVGQDGLALGYSKETIERVREPRNYALDGEVHAGFSYGTNIKNRETFVLNTYMGLVDVEFVFMVGSKFPGPEGGNWFGVVIQPGFQFLVGGQDMTMTIPATAYTSASKMSSSGSVFASNPGGALGLQFLHFGSMDEETLKQWGFGIRAGMRVGFQYMKTTAKVNTPMGTQTTETEYRDFSWGPFLGIKIPKYNAGTADTSSININFMVLPTGDFIMGSVMVGYAF